MTAPEGPAECPTCSGEQLVGNPGGVLVFDHSMACSLRRLEDQRRVADYDRVRRGTSFRRPATDTERVLLTAVGAPPEVTADPGLETSVTLSGVIARWWAAWPSDEGMG